MDSIRPQDVQPDPLITQWAIEYGQGGGFIADSAAPQVRVGRQRFKYATYKADQLNDEVETRVGPGGTPSEYRFQAPTWADGSAERNVLDGNINREVQLQLSNPILGEQRRVQKLTFKLRLGIESRVHTIYHAATQTTAAGTTWDNAGATASGVRKNIDDAAETLSLRAGSGDVFGGMNILINVATARVLARLISAFVIAGDPQMFVGGLFPQGLWGYTWHIAGATINSGGPKADFSQTISRIWSDKEAYLFITDPAPTLESFGFAFQATWPQFGNEYSGYTWPDPHQSKKVTWFSVENFQTELAVCDSACQRITGVLA